MSKRLWLARALIFFVLFVNVQCALVFLFFPEQYAGGFELEGVPGLAAVRGIGILFLMWNIPYGMAFSHPVARRTSLVEATMMQTIGLVGESWLATGLPAGHLALRASIGRFIVFDGVGLVLLAAALLLTLKFPIVGKSPFDRS